MKEIVGTISSLLAKMDFHFHNGDRLTFDAATYESVNFILEYLRDTESQRQKIEIQPTKPFRFLYDERSLELLVTIIAHMEKESLEFIASGFVHSDYRGK